MLASLGGCSRRAHRWSMPAATKPRSRKSPTTSRGGSKPQSLLVLHFDAQKLRADHLHLGEIAAVTAAVSGLALGGNAVVEDVTTKSDLMSKLARFAENRVTFDVVVAVGHSNADGIRVASDLFLQWGPFAQLLKPFKPRRLLLVACQTGRANAGEALFCSLPQLRRIYACPVNASKDFGTAMMVAIPYVVSERRPKDRHVAWSQAASIALTGRQLREWRRTTDKGVLTRRSLICWPSLPIPSHVQFHRFSAPCFVDDVAAATRPTSRRPTAAAVLASRGCPAAPHVTRAR